MGTGTHSLFNQQFHVIYVYLLVCQMLMRLFLQYENDINLRLKGLAFKECTSNVTGHLGSLVMEHGRCKSIGNQAKVLYWDPLNADRLMHRLFINGRF